MVPNHSFLEDLSTCLFGVYPDNFFDKLKEGSIIMKGSQNFSFCREGVIIDGEAKPLESDIVFFATGYKGDQKIKNIFKSPLFQKYIIGQATSTVPLYRSVSAWFGPFFFIYLFIITLNIFSCHFYVI